jgi:hypothetical protein
MPIMPDALTNEEKINIVNQHIRSVQFASYNAELDLIEANAVSSPDAEVIAEINTRKAAIDAKLAALNAEKTSLQSE